ncbi:MAG TPA: hypothetical protein VFR57_05435 [Burkholderiales bacterium]|nr:hypothetical protein [Burkholderiales bacterium]
MKPTLFNALIVALFASLLPACERVATDREEAAASKGGTAGQTPARGATGQASEGSANDRNAPARPSSK